MSMIRKYHNSSRLSLCSVCVCVGGGGGGGGGFFFQIGKKSHLNPTLGKGPKNKGPNFGP